MREPVWPELGNAMGMYPNNRRLKLFRVENYLTLFSQTKLPDPSSRRWIRYEICN